MAVETVSIVRCDLCGEEGASPYVVGRDIAMPLDLCNKDAQHLWPLLDAAENARLAREAEVKPDQAMRKMLDGYLVP